MDNLIGKGASSFISPQTLMTIMTTTMMMKMVMMRMKMIRITTIITTK